MHGTTNCLRLSACTRSGRPSTATTSISSSIPLRKTASFVTPWVRMAPASPTRDGRKSATSLRKAVREQSGHPVARHGRICFGQPWRRGVASDCDDVHWREAGLARLRYLHLPRQHDRAERYVLQDQAIGTASPVGGQLPDMQRNEAAQIKRAARKPPFCCSVSDDLTRRPLRAAPVRRPWSSRGPRRWPGRPPSSTAASCRGRRSRAA